VSGAEVRAARASTASRLRELRPYLTRLVRWQPIVTTAAVALLVGRLRPVPPQVKETAMAVLVALGTTTLLDDPAAPLVASSPSTRRWRHGLRLAVAAPAIAGLWWAASRVAASPSPLATMAGLLELAGLAAVAVAGAAFAVRHDERSSGAAFAGPALLGFVVLVATLPEGWSLFPPQGHEGRWAAVAVAGLAATAGASRDLAAAPLLR
jgi:hypothetical protein